MYGNFCRQQLFERINGMGGFMENNDGYFKKLAAGLFFIIGLSLIAVSVFFIGLDRGITEPKFQVIALFMSQAVIIQR